MPARLHRRLAERATPRTLAIGALLWIASAAGAYALQARVVSRSGGATVPDVQLFYTSEDLYTLLERYGEAGRRAFLEFTLYDVLYPFVAYGLVALALASLTRSLVQTRPGWARLVLVPLAGLVVELLEQAGFLVILALFPARVQALACAVSALTVVKFLVIATILCSLGALGLWRVLSFVRRPTS